MIPQAVAAQPAPAAPAAEPIPLVEVYGTLFPFLEAARSTGATTPALIPNMTGASQVATYSGLNQPGRLRMDSGTTNFGLRGGVEIMRNLSVIWQIESGIQLDNGAAGASTIASRNTQLGLTGSWGTLFVGNWDTPYKWSTVSLVNPVRGGFLPDYNGILNSPGLGIGSVTTQAGRVGGAADAAFDRRQGNSIQYWTPTISGFSARLMYAIDEGRNATTPMAPSIKPSMLGASVNLELGPLTLREAFEAHFDYFGMSQIGGGPGDTVNNRHSTDFGNKVMAQFLNRANGFDTRVVGVFDFLSYENDDIVMNNHKKFSRPGLYGIIDQTLMGKHHIWLALGKVFEGSCEKVGGAACSTTGLSATDAAIGYLYRATKSFDLFVAAYRIGNDKSASYGTSPALGAPQATAPGVTIESFGIGMFYTFSAKVIGPPGKPAAAPPPPPTPPPAPTNEPGPVPSPTPGATTPPPADAPPAPQPHG